MRDDDEVKTDEDELGENTFGASDLLEEDLDPDALVEDDAAVVDPLAATDDADVVTPAGDDEEDGGEVDDGFSEFNDYEE